MSIFCSGYNKYIDSSKKEFDAAPDEVWRLNVHVELLSGEQLIVHHDIRKRIQNVYVPGADFPSLRFVSAKDACEKYYKTMKFEKETSFVCDGTTYLMQAVKCYYYQTPFLWGEYKTETNFIKNPLIQDID